MPEETVLRCDAPDCDELGEYVTVIVEGETYGVILGPKHLPVVREIVKWGRPIESPQSIRRGKRSTDPGRLERLFRAE